MSVDSAPSGATYPRWLVGATLAVAALQLALAVRSGAQEFWLACITAIGAALFIASKVPPADAPPGETSVARSALRPAWAAAGAALIAVSLLELVPAAYATAHRFTPLCAGLGVAVAAGGLRFARRQLKALSMLALTLVVPAPHLLREHLDLSHGTAIAAAAALHMARVPVVRDGILLHLQHSTLEVLVGCDGTSQIVELLALAAFAMMLFPTTLMQKAGLVLSSVVVAFCVNAARVAALGMLADSSRWARRRWLR
jgi:exosortase/archaeosortase family protein